MITVRSGRMIGKGRKLSSRASRGSRPARRNEDLPAPDAPRITRSRDGAPSRKPRSASSVSTHLGVASEKNAGVIGLERSQAAIGRPLRVGFRRPRKEAELEAGPLQSGLEPAERLGREGDMRFLAGKRHGHPEHDMVCAGPEPHHLPGAGEIEREVGNGKVIDEEAEQPLVELIREVEFLETPARSQPIPRNQKEHRLATRRRLVERPLPAFTRGDASVRIDIEEDIVPTFTLQPITKCDRLDVIRTRMAQENARHAPARGNSAPMQRKL